MNIYFSKLMYLSIQVPYKSLNQLLKFYMIKNLKLYVYIQLSTKDAKTYFLHG